MHQKIVTKAEDRHYTLGIVYAPNDVDTHGEFTDSDTIEKAAWEYLERLQQMASVAKDIITAVDSSEGECEVVIDKDQIEAVKGAGDGLDDEHYQIKEKAGTVVESYIAPTDFELNGEKVTKGTWLLGVVWEPEIFAKIKSGERTGLSLYGFLEMV